jgi:hypothetical protein
MLQSRAGSRAEADFLRDVADGLYELVQITAADAKRAADLVEQYSDLPLGTADAIVIAIAERFRAVNIATLWTGATSASSARPTQHCSPSFRSHSDVPGVGAPA